MISKVIYDADIDDFFFLFGDQKEFFFRDEARDEMKGGLPTRSPVASTVPSSISGQIETEGNALSDALDHGAVKACVRSPPKI